MMQEEREEVEEQMETKKSPANSAAPSESDQKEAVSAEKCHTLSEAEYQGLLRDQLELKETKERLLRSAADFENTKKRLERQKEEFVQFANKNLLTEFLPIIDNLDRAIASAKKNPSVESLLQGLDMISKQLMETLKNHGLVKLEALGKPFDPNHHEAIGTIESAEHQEETVLEEISSGYLYRDMLLKPALVRISARSSSEEDSSNQNK